jgi:prepilin-type N-terminal cleavage/methylation domain-containing protein
MKKYWFTLIELMIVIAVIAILAAVMFPSIANYAARARDSQRILDIRGIWLALEDYSINDNIPFPTASSYGRWASAPGFWNTWWDVSGYTPASGSQFLQFLSDGQYMSRIPKDPLTKNLPNELRKAANAVPEYIYYTVPAGYANTCVGTGQTIALLAIGKFEHKKPTALQSGCSCLFDETNHPGWGGNPWGPGFFDNQFAYVTCKVFGTAL